MERIAINIALDAVQAADAVLFELTQGDRNAHALNVRAYNGGAELAFSPSANAQFAFFSADTLLASMTGRIGQSGIECDLSPECASASGKIRCRLRITDGDALYTLSRFCYYVHPLEEEAQEEELDISDATARECDVLAGKIAYGIAKSGGHGRITGAFLAIEPEHSGMTLVRAAETYAVPDGGTLMLRAGDGAFEEMSSFAFLFIRPSAHERYIGGFIDTDAHFLDTARCPDSLPAGLHVYAIDVKCYVENRSGSDAEISVEAFGYAQ